MKSVTFRLSEDDQRCLKLYADKHGLTQAEAIRIAIQNLNQKQDKPQPKTGMETSPTVDALINQLTAKDVQIRELNKALVNAQDIAKAAQALNAADKPLPLDSGGETGKPTRWQRLKAAWRN